MWTYWSLRMNNFLWCLDKKNASLAISINEVSFEDFKQKKMELQNLFRKRLEKQGRKENIWENILVLIIDVVGVWLVLDGKVKFLFWGGMEGGRI